MKRQVVYSGSRRAASGSVPAHPAAAEPAPPPPPDASAPRRLRDFGSRYRSLIVSFACAALALPAAIAYFESQPRPQQLTQEDVDAAVLHTLENKAVPSRAAKAAEMVRPAVVRVNSFGDPEEPKAAAKERAKRPPRKFDHGKKAEKDKESSGDGLEPLGLGTGVVIVDDGTILTNLHVVYGAKRLTVTFFDGSEAEAKLVSVHPENDLAVIKAQKIPDDLPAATLGSAGRLKPGDEVVAVGFPFGMGPSVSYGVVSGLNREFRSPEGERLLTRLIQFDAAANFGNSGGPLVTMQGDVVGIVTAIMNPTEAGTFIGIGFAVTIAAAGRAVGMHPC